MKLRKFKNRFLLILFGLSSLFLTACKESGKTVSTLESASNIVRAILAKPSIQIIIVFIVSWIFFYTVFNWSLKKAHVFTEGDELARPGEALAIALAVLFTLPVLYATKRIDFALFQTRLGFLAGLLLFIAAFWFSYNWLKESFK